MKCENGVQNLKGLHNLHSTLQYSQTTEASYSLTRKLNGY